jgi:large subunit ribosomal protein L24
MKQDFSTKWKSSKQPRKQRKYSYNAPAHLKRKQLSVRLSKDLTKKHNKRSLPARKGDRAKIVRGSFRGKDGKVDGVDINKSRIFIAGIERTKIDGSKSLYPIHPSNLILTEINVEDKKRKKVLDRKSKEAKK